MDSKKENEAFIKKILNINGKRSVTNFHSRLGSIMWEYVGMAREDKGLIKAKDMIFELKQEFWEDLKVPGSNNEFNQQLSRAIRVADYLDFALLMVEDALSRRESCGCHFNVQFQTEEHEPLRDDKNCAYVAAWEFRGENQPFLLHKEPLIFEYVEPGKRSYK